MTSPRIEVDLSKVRYNTQHLVELLKLHGISITAVTKAVCGHPAIAQAMLDGGAVGLGEARISNVERLRAAGITSSIALIRTPMLSQTDLVVQSCDTSYNTELSVITSLAAAARKANSVHGVVLMLEMGDMREGIMPTDIEAFAEHVIATPGVALKGIGANFACLSSTVPDAAKMVALSTIANDIERTFGPYVGTVSGGNSANLPWALGHHPKGRVDNLRLGEAILLGVEPVSGDAINGLFTDAFSLIVEVIEKKVKPMPISPVDPARLAVRSLSDKTHSVRSIIAIGTQDTDMSGLTLPVGVSYLGSTSDHMVVQTTRSHPSVGSEIKLKLNYSALMRAMSAPDISKIILNEAPTLKTRSKGQDGPSLVLAQSE